MKILSMTERRPQDVRDAASLLKANRALDLQTVRALLRVIDERGYGRGEDLEEKLRGALRRAAC